MMRNGLRDVTAASRLCRWFAVASASQICTRHQRQQCSPMQKNERSCALTILHLHESSKQCRFATYVFCSTMQSSLYVHCLINSGQFQLNNAEALREGMGCGEGALKPSGVRGRAKRGSKKYHKQRLHAVGRGGGRGQNPSHPIQSSLQSLGCRTVFLG